MFAGLSHRRRGFSLVELLVVVVIIALLIAILLPALAAVKERGRKLKAETMLRRVLDSCQAYSLDFDGAMPGYVDDSDLDDSFTATENMVVSLMGGVVDSGGDYTLNGTQFSNSAVGSGPEDAEGRTFEPYFSPQKGELRQVSGTAAGDDPNPIRTLVDPQNGLPVLYFRKQSGYGQPVSTNAGGGGAFLLSPIDDYRNASALEGADGRPFNQSTKSLLAGGNAAESLAWAAINPTLSNPANGANGSDDVVGGSVLLLTAGEDGIYLNSDMRSSISNHDQLDAFGDAYAVGAGN